MQGKASKVGGKSKATVASKKPKRVLSKSSWGVAILKFFLRTMPTKHPTVIIEIPEDRATQEVVPKVARPLQTLTTFVDKDSSLEFIRIEDHCDFMS
ncbi:hypothetical protein ACOSQ3_024786 [Xanthoceras sorbifolium]